MEHKVVRLQNSSLDVETSEYKWDFKSPSFFPLEDGGTPLSLSGEQLSCSRKGGFLDVQLVVFLILLCVPLTYCYGFDSL